MQLADGAHECNVVRGEWERKAQGGLGPWHSVRTLCIDTRRLILRESSETTEAKSGTRSVTTITVRMCERNPNFAPEEFQISLPTGAMEDQGPQTGQGEPAPVNGVYPISQSVSYPRLVFKVEPSYTEEALESKVSGIVLVSLAVGADGTPRNMKVVRGLGHGLDEKAIEAVGRWHFDAGRRAVVPLAAGHVTLAVNFRKP